MTGNCPQALAIAWGAYRCGLYLTPIATSLAATEVAYLVDDNDSRVVVAEAEFATLAAPLPGLARRRIDWLALHGDIPGFEPIEPALAAASPAPAADEPPGALMLYTSGTTGTPKA